MDILSAAAAALPFVEQWTTTIKSERSQKANELKRTSPFAAAAAVVSAGKEGRGEYKRLEFFPSYCT